MPNFEQPIVTENLQEHEKMLMDRLAEVELNYADQLFSQQKNEENPAKFSEIALVKTALLFHIDNNYHHRYQGDPDMAQKANADLKPILDTIDQIYANKIEDADWTEKIILLINEENEKIKLANGPQPETKKTIGPLQYNEKQDSASLKKEGYDENDDLMEVHLEQLYKTEQKDIQAGQVKELLEKLALLIVEEYTKTRAILGTSWLMDTPVAKRLGFIISNQEVPANQLSTWLQFVDKDGQINQKRVEQLQTTGRPPYTARTGFMTVENFLDKYLPAEKRGQEITLKIMPEKWKEFKKNLEASTRLLKNDWPKLKTEEISEQSIQQNYPLILEMLEKIGQKQNFLDLLKKMKEENLDWESARNKYSADFEKLGEPMQQYLDNHIYEDKILIFD